MSRQQCPDCGSSRGLAVYQTSRKCFACGKYERINSLTEIAPHVKREGILDPGDLTKDALNWLYQYFNKDEIDKFRIQYCRNYNRIVIPCYNDELLAAAWMRSTDPNVKPKWVLWGDKDSTFYFKKGDTPGNEVTLVEDVISAMKVSKYVDCICLGGTYLKEKEENLLKYYYKNVILFLDGDEAGRSAAERIERKLRLYMHSIRRIRNLKDPKNYSKSELEEVFCDRSNIT